jgi:hypothetical protein
MTRLLGKGASQAAVARSLGLDRKTIRRWMRREGPPRWTRPREPIVLDPHRNHLEKRWQEGFATAPSWGGELALREQGIKPRLVREWATRRRRESADGMNALPSQPGRRWRPPSTNRVARLLQTDYSRLTGRERDFVERLLDGIPDLRRVVDLVGCFTRLLRRQSDERLSD